jgi:acetyl-CoA synthetase
MTELDRFLTARDFLLECRDDYERAVSGFHWPELTRFNWASDYFDTLASGNDAPALLIVEPSGEQTERSYEELSRRSSRIASFLAAQGIDKGDRLLVMLGNEVELWEISLAAIKLGAVLIPTTPLLATADVTDRLKRSDARMIVANPAGAATIEALSGDVLGERLLVATGGPRESWLELADAQAASDSFEPAATTTQDPLIEYFTSGTTTHPKLVRHTQASYPVGHLSTMYWLGLRPGDVHWTVSSPGWAKHAWGCFFAPFNAEACVFVYNYARFDGPAVLDALVEHRVSTLCAPPTVWRFLIQEDIASYPVALRELMSAGEPLNPEVIEHVRREWRLPIRDGFGQTETTAQIGNPPGVELRPGSMGLPLPGYRIALLDPDGAEAEEGEVAIALGDERPLALMEGYADDEAATREAMREGYYRTGDIGSRDADGYITYVGRADDVFKASGYRISPFEVESALIEHPAVAEAAVVPSPDAMRGFVPKAYVIAAPGHTASAETARSIFEHMRERVSGYKRARRVEFSDLPKTISGKIRRVELREQEATRPASGTRSASEFLESELVD